MTFLRAALITGAVVAIVGSGCDGTGATITSGEYSVGRVDFNFGGGETWRLNDVLVTVDTAQRRVFLSGFDRQNQLWVYGGSYSRTEGRLVGTDLPEIELGSADRIDLHLEFSRNTFSGAVINWVYDGRELANVGAARISGRRIGPIGTRDVVTPAQRSDEEGPKFDEN